MATSPGRWIYSKTCPERPPKQSEKVVFRVLWSLPGVQKQYKSGRRELKCVPLAGTGLSSEVVSQASLTVYV